jgi:hypothetical protein
MAGALLVESSGWGSDRTPLEIRRVAEVLALVDDDRAAGEDRAGTPGDPLALVRRVVHVHVVGLRRHRVPLFGVVDHDVRVRAGRDGALARVEAEHARGSRAGDLDPAAPGDVALQHGLVHQVDPVLHAGQAIGDLGEVAAAELLLPDEAERAVVGGDHGEIVGA